MALVRNRNLFNEKKVKTAAQNSKKMIVELKGRLTIENIDPIQAKLEQAMSAGKPVEVQLSQVIDIDLAIVQLFYYFLNQPNQHGFKVEILHQLPIGISSVLSRCGLSGFSPKSVKNI